MCLFPSPQAKLRNPIKLLVKIRNAYKKKVKTFHCWVGHLFRQWICQSTLSTTLSSRKTRIGEQREVIPVWVARCLDFSEDSKEDSQVEMNCYYPPKRVIPQHQEAAGYIANIGYQKGQLLPHQRTVQGPLQDFLKNASSDKEVAFGYLPNTV